MILHRNRTALAGALLIAASLGLALAQDKNASGKQTEKKGETQEPVKAAPKAEMPLCPVSGEPVNYHVSAKSQGGVVYYCCPSCPTKVKETPEKFAAKIAAQRQMLAKLPSVQVICPVSGEPVDPKVMIKLGKREFRFCCEKCVAKFEKTPAEYLPKMPQCRTYQLNCPVSGKPISPGEFVTTADDHKIYFCSKQCREKFKDHEADYLPKLAEQGYPYEKGKDGLHAKTGM